MQEQLPQDFILRDIELEEDFSPFDPKYTLKKQINNSVQYYSYVRVRSEDLFPPFPLAIYATPGDYDEYFNALTPFNIADGYQINDADFIWERRLKKVRGLIREGVEPIYSQKHPLKLFAQAGHPDMVGSIVSPDSLFSYEHWGDFEIREHIISLLKGLRLSVAFPESVYESVEPNPASLADMILGIWEFYPKDQGPLALVDQSTIPPVSLTDMYRGIVPWESIGRLLYEGLHLYLPSDPTKLSVIKSRLAYEN